MCIRDRHTIPCRSGACRAAARHRYPANRAPSRAIRLSRGSAYTAACPDSCLPTRIYVQSDMLHAPARLDGILVFDTGSGQLSPELSQLNLPGLFFAAQYSVTGQHEFTVVLGQVTPETRFCHFADTAYLPESSVEAYISIARRYFSSVSGLMPLKRLLSLLSFPDVFIGFHEASFRTTVLPPARTKRP